MTTPTSNEYLKSSKIEKKIDRKIDLYDVFFLTLRKVQILFTHHGPKITKVFCGLFNMAL